MKEKVTPRPTQLEPFDHFNCSGSSCNYDKSLSCLQFASLSLQQRLDRKVKALMPKGSR
jgi:hypothetical protein